MGAVSKTRTVCQRTFRLCLQRVSNVPRPAAQMRPRNVIECPEFHGTTRGNLNGYLPLAAGPAKELWLSGVATRLCERHFVIVVMGTFLG